MTKHDHEPDRCLIALHDDGNEIDPIVIMTPTCVESHPWLDQRYIARNGPMPPCTSASRKLSQSSAARLCMLYLALGRLCCFKVWGWCRQPITLSPGVEFRRRSGRNEGEARNALGGFTPQDRTLREAFWAVLWRRQCANPKLMQCRKAPLHSITTARLKR